MNKKECEQLSINLILWLSYIILSHLILKEKKIKERRRRTKRYWELSSSAAALKNATTNNID